MRDIGRIIERLTIRTVLLAGFGLMLGLWLFAGYQVTQRVGQAQRNSAGVGTRYQQSQELLASVRARVLEASVQLRDALLDPDVAAQAEHRQSIEKAYAAIDTSLGNACRSSIRPQNANESIVFALRFVNSVPSDEVLATDSSRWPAEARTLLRRFMPKRESAIRVSDDVQALNRAAFIDQQREVTEDAGRDAASGLDRVRCGARHQPGDRLAGIAACGDARRRLLEQHDREERIASDLQRLSARLVHA